MESFYIHYIQKNSNNKISITFSGLKPAIHVIISSIKEKYKRNNNIHVDASKENIEFKSTLHAIFLKKDLLSIIEIYSRNSCIYIC